MSAGAAAAGLWTKVQARPERSVRSPDRTRGSSIGAAVYIDGLNLYYGALRGKPFRWLDLASLSHALLPRETLTRIAYFTALIRPSEVGDRGPDRQRLYLRALEIRGEVDLHLGAFRRDVRRRMLADASVAPQRLFDPRFLPAEQFMSMWNDHVSRRRGPGTLARVFINEEKGSDVNLGVELVRDCLTGRCRKALVISNDSDLIHAIRVAREGRVPVGVCSPVPERPANRGLRAVADFEIVLRESTLRRSQLPRRLPTPSGGNLEAPHGWTEPVPS